jgi:hypothetical protein
MSDFVSYYWTPETLGSQELTRVFQQLVSEESVPEDKANLLHVLLESKSVVAQGIAFDHFFYAESLSRYGVDNPYQPYRDDLLVKAREQLRGPAVTNAAPDGTPVVGANHASAFGVLAHLGTKRDLDLIAPILKTSDDVNVLFTGCLAAQRSLSMTKKDHPAIMSGLARIILGKEWPEDLRIMAISSLDAYDNPAADVTLLSAARELSLPISAYAAHLIALRDLEKYRGLLQEIVGNWPEDAKYPADEVRSLLRSNPFESNHE